MPHPHRISNEEYELIPRVTEVGDSINCEWKAYANPVNRDRRTGKTTKRRWTTTNIYALRGTIVHWKVANFYREHYTNEARVTFSDELKGGDKAYWRHLEKNHPDDATRVMEFVEHCYDDNFVDFWKEYGKDIEPLAIELFMLSYHGVGHRDNLKGTVDVLCEMGWMGQYGTTFIDWKSSTRMYDHSKQLTAYYWLLHKSGTFKKLVAAGIIREPWLKIDGRPVGFVVALGGTKPIIKMFYLDNPDFFRAFNVFNAAEATTLSHKSGRVGGFKQGVTCTMCPERDEGCPVFFKYEEVYENE